MWGNYIGPDFAAKAAFLKGYFFVCGLGPQTKKYSPFIPRL
jgi:hypothetical protein